MDEDQTSYFQRFYTCDLGSSILNLNTSEHDQEDDDEVMEKKDKAEEEEAPSKSTGAASCLEVGCTSEKKSFIGSLWEKNRGFTGFWPRPKSPPESDDDEGEDSLEETPTTTKERPSLQDRIAEVVTIVSPAANLVETKTSKKGKCCPVPQPTQYDCCYIKEQNPLAPPCCQKQEEEPCDERCCPCAPPGYTEAPNCGCDTCKEAGYHGRCYDQRTAYNETPPQLEKA